MKIVHLVRLYYPHVGGIEKHLEKLNKIFLVKGHSVTVMTQQYNSNLSKTEKIDGVNIVRLASIKNDSQNTSKTFKVLYKLKTWWGILKNLRILFLADVIHIHDVMWWLLPFYPFFGHKIYITFHGYEGNDNPKWRQVFWHKLANKLTRGNICVGGFHKKWYRVKPTIVTFGAVESLNKKLSKHNSKNKINSKSNSKNKKIIFIGRLASDNGILEYLEALKLLKNKGYNFSLDVYGDGPLLNQSKKYVNKHNLKVVFHGFVFNAQQFLPKYKFAFISRYLGILEALSAEVQVTAHYNNEIKEDYLKLSPFSEFIDIVSSALEISSAVLNDLEKTKSSKRKQAKAWVDKQTWEKMTENYFKLWQK